MTTGVSKENISSLSTNPFHQSSDSSMNPFTSIAYNKNPFDPMDQSELQNAFSFSGFGKFSWIFSHRNQTAMPILFCSRKVLKSGL